MFREFGVAIVVGISDRCLQCFTMFIYFCERDTKAEEIGKEPEKSVERCVKGDSFCFY